MGKGYIKVNPKELADAAAVLDRMVNEFSHAQGIADAAKHVLGSDEISDAMHDFATNWSQQRERICKTMEECSHALHDGARAYERADTHLAGSAHQLVQK